jgi:D-xylose 1-dehydrogenase
MSSSPVTERRASPAGGFARYPSLVDQVAFVSGGATGLGAEFVTQLAAQGARVAFVDLDEQSGESLANAIEASGDPAPLFLGCDVRDIPALQASIVRAAQHFGPVTILVNNAANDTRDRVDDMTVELWDDRIAVNVRHQFFAAQAVRAGMREAGHGSIINLGSISAHIDLMDLPGYITAKAGVEGLTRTLAREMGPDGIRVNCIIPGWVMTDRQLRDWVTPEALESIARNQCIPGVLYPDDVARLMLWLASEDSRACTAQKWIVDGGWM